MLRPQSNCKMFWKAVRSIKPIERCIPLKIKYGHATYVTSFETEHGFLHIYSCYKYYK